MLKKGIFLFLIGFIFTMFILMGCDENRFEIHTKVTPNLTIVDRGIAVEYQIGNILVLDEWKKLNTAQIIFLTRGEPKTFELTIESGDWSLNEDGFYYTFGNIEIKTDPIKFKVLLKHVDSLPDVIWKVRDGEEVKNKPISSKEESKSNDTRGKKL
jgi:hypothetical protein